MAGLDDLFAEIPVQDIASKLGADEGEVNNAIRTLVPALVGGLAENVQANEIDSSELESAVTEQGARAACSTAGSASIRSTQSRATSTSRRSSAATTATRSPPHWPERAPAAVI